MADRYVSTHHVFRHAEDAHEDMAYALNRLRDLAMVAFARSLPRFKPSDLKIESMALRHADAADRSLFGQGGESVAILDVVWEAGVDE